MWDGKGKMSTCIVRISAEIVGKKALINGTSLPPSPGKFLLLFLLFTTFPSFIPFSDLVLLFPFPPQMLLLPPRSGGLLAAGDSQPLRRMAGARRKVGCCWRGHRCLRRRMGPTVCCRVSTGPVSLLPSSSTCLFPRDRVGTKPSRVALGASYPFPAQGWGQAGVAEMVNVFSGEDGGCEPLLGCAWCGLGSIGAACYLLSISIPQKAAFREGLSAAATAAGSNNHKLPHRDGRERAALPPSYQNSFVACGHFVSISAWLQPCWHRIMRNLHFDKGSEVTAAGDQGLIY